jgi:hypothetical protein
VAKRGRQNWDWGTIRGVSGSVGSRKKIDPALLAFAPNWPRFLASKPPKTA